MYLFLLQYYCDKQTSTCEDLSKEKISGALGIKVRRILAVVSPRNGCLALMSTSRRYRPSQVRRALTATKYNQVDKGGLQIMGEDGLKIYTSSKHDKYDDQDLFTTYMGLFEQYCEMKGITLGKYLSNWSDAHAKPKPAPTPPTADDTLAIAAALSAPWGDDDGSSNSDVGGDGAVTAGAAAVAANMLQAADA